MRVGEIILGMSSSKCFEENSLLLGEQQLSLKRYASFWLAAVIFIMLCIKQTATSRPVVLAALLKVFTGRIWYLNKLLKM